MVERHLRWMPVCDEAGRVLGVVSRSDVLAVFLRDDASIRAELADEVLGVDAQGVQVDVRDGVVTLAGEVATRIDAERLVRVSERVEGVVGVADHLTYRRDEQLADHVASSVVDPLAGGLCGLGRRSVTEPPTSRLHIAGTVRAQADTRLVLGHSRHPASDTALHVAVDLARRLRGRTSTSCTASSLADYPVDPDAADWEEQARRALDEQRRRVEAALADFPMRWTYQAGHGNPARLIATVAEETDAFMIIVGSHGGGPSATFDRLLLHGSVSPDGAAATASPGPHRSRRVARLRSEVTRAVQTRRRGPSAFRVVNDRRRSDGPSVLRLKSGPQV